MNRGLGSGENGQWTFLDLLSAMSFFIGVQNLDLNVTQEDAQKLMHELDTKTATLLNEIHGHLKQQDRKIDQILEVIQNDHEEN